jgi:hypothetical protein
MLLIYLKASKKMTMPSITVIAASAGCVLSYAAMTKNAAQRRKWTFCEAVKH